MLSKGALCSMDQYYAGVKTELGKLQNPAVCTGEISGIYINLILNITYCCIIAYLHISFYITEK
jgi:hypothetical protein